MKMMFTTLHNKTFLISLFLLSVIQNHSSAQGCNPDTTAPELYRAVSYKFMANRNVSFILNSKHIVGLFAIDNCTYKGHFRQSYSENPNDTLLLLTAPVASSYFKVIYVFDESGNYASNLMEIEIEDCSNGFVCNNNANITLTENGPVNVTLNHLLGSIPCYNRNYTATWVNDKGVTSALTYIDSTFPKSFPFRVTEAVTQNSCWGILNITEKVCINENKFVFEKNDKRLVCSDYNSIADIGYPTQSISTNFSLTENKVYSFLPGVCNPTFLEFHDSTTVLDCSNTFLFRVYRMWKATKPNKSIVYHTQLLDYDLSFANNFPLLQDKSYECNDSKLVNGVPKPDYSGYPMDLHCIDKFFALSHQDQISSIKNECEETNRIIRTWTLTNKCTGEIYAKKQVINVTCNRDIIKPKAICKPQVVVDLQGARTIELIASDFDNGSNDNCGIASFSFDSGGAQLRKVFDAKTTEQKLNVMIYLRDVGANVNVCNSELVIPAVSSNPYEKPVVSGLIMNYNLVPFSKLDKSKLNPIEFKNANQSTILNLCDHQILDYTYQFCMDSSASTKTGNIHINYNDNPLNGVSTVDFVLLLRSIFGMEKFSPFQKIAADVNCDNAINIADLFELRKLLLGITNKFPCNYFECYVADTINITKFSDLPITSIPVLNLNFVPVFKGDVNLTRFKFGKEILDTRGDAEVKLIYDDIAMTAGNTYDIWIRADKKYEIYALQFGQIYDPAKIEILDINSTLFALTNSIDYAINDSDWRMLLMAQNANKFAIENGFIKLKVKALVNTNVSNAFSKDHPTYPRIAINNDLEIVTAILVSSSTTGVLHQNEDYNISVSPNPFSGDVNISFTDLDKGVKSITVQSVDGRTIYQENLSAWAKEISIKGSVFPTVGVYFISLISGSSLYTTKVLKI